MDTFTFYGTHFHFLFNYQIEAAEGGEEEEGKDEREEKEEEDVKMWRLEVKRHNR